MNYKTINWILTYQHWQRGTDIDELMKRAKKEMGIKQKSEYIRYIGIIKPHATEDQVANLQLLWCVTDMGGLTRCDGLSDEDEQMIKDYFVGWIVEHYNFPKKKLVTNHKTK